MLSANFRINPQPRTNQRAWFLVVVLVSWLLSACSSGGTVPTVGDPAPDFKLSTTEGTTVSLSDYQGKQAVLLYFHMAVG